MSKIAFSVWPDISGNTIPENLIKLWEVSKSTLEKAGYKVELYSDLKLGEDPISSLIMSNKAHSKNFYTKISDYLRLRAMKEYFAAGNSEVMYFDMDMLLLEAPLGWGCIQEFHLETKVPYGEIDKFWYRAANGIYRFNNSQEHQSALDEHIRFVNQEVISAEGNPKFCYPMNLMWMIEESVTHLGVVNNYWHFGYLDNPNFCNLDMINDMMVLQYHMNGGTIPKIHGVNAMGNFRETGDVQGEVDQLIEINSNLQNLDYSRSNASRIMSKLTPKCRIRPNYNSSIKREQLKKFIASFK